MKPPNDPFEASKLYIVNVNVNVNLKLKNMKAMSKSELADRAGVSVNTLMSWCKPFQQELTAMGMLPNAKVLPPHIVQFIIEKFCIDV